MPLFAVVDRPVTLDEGPTTPDYQAATSHTHDCDTINGVETTVRRGGVIFLGLPADLHDKVIWSD